MKKKTTLIALMLVCSLGLSNAGTQDEYKFHGMFILNFLRYIQWSDASQEFVIGILGDASVMPDLERSAATRMVNGKKIVIRRFSRALDLSEECKLVYIPIEKSDELAQVVSFVGNKSLIVTAKDGLRQKGSCINFVIKEGKWRFEINEAAAEKARLKISSELSRLAM
jgi:hypothetical protein